MDVHEHFRITRGDLHAADEATSSLPDDALVQLSRTSNGAELVMLDWRGAKTGVAIVRSGEVIERDDLDGLEEDDFDD